MRAIIITGGELFNKGAQAMTFIAVNEMKKRFPNHEIYLLSELDNRRPKVEKELYAFRFTGWFPPKYAQAQNNMLQRLMCLVRNPKQYSECISLYRNCDLMIDISGYGFGSNWSKKQLRFYLEHLEFAKAFGIPCYLLPQSFGPFDFQLNQKEEEHIQELLSYPKLICAREQSGYDGLISKYHLNNVELWSDMVLCNTGIDINAVYRNAPVLRVPTIRSGSVGVIPNTNLLKFIDESELLCLYDRIVNELLRCGKRVVFVSHADSDRPFCRKLSSLYGMEGVSVLDQDYNCLEFNEIVKQFQFIISSRYHGIVHAYKNLIPVISIGWADKYSELLDAFEQSSYSFDARNEINVDAMLISIHRMADRYGHEKELIGKRLKTYQEENVFNFIAL